MKAPSKQQSLISLLYDNPLRSFGIPELQLLIRIQSHQGVIKTINNLRKAGAKIKTISSSDGTRYQIVI